MGRVWKRILAAADDHVALGIALSEEQARDIALAIARDEGIEPSEEILAYHAYALARRTQR